MSGSGKTIVLKLLLGFFQPDTGEIEIHGHNVRQTSLCMIRGSCAYVAQGPYLFDISIAENIRCGGPGASDADVEAAARAANAHNFTVQILEGYSFVVGERGAGL